MKDFSGILELTEKSLESYVGQFEDYDRAEVVSGIRGKASPD